ncbi:hypothetical protein TIFTF001_037169 [Ficus carica]|uniref:Uncharacterized protein n=1 Tax=Ficus carica TaxID=3494 RepID=A0AA88E4R8_FICCA|nr:hypothetical protein TIFTF001_037169 [Ficus carica]
MVDRWLWPPAGGECQPGWLRQTRQVVIAVAVMTTGNPCWPNGLGHPAAGWACLITG